jgi:putative oxidoreductase
MPLGTHNLLYRSVVMLPFARAMTFHTSGPTGLFYQELIMSRVTELASPSATPALPLHAAFALRISLGGVLLSHGLLKLLTFGLAGTAAFFDSLGFAAWLAYPVIGFEVLAGALIVLGLWVRPLAIIAAVLLAVTIYVHSPNGWLFSAPNGGWEYPLYLTLTALAVALAGEGAYALRLPLLRKSETPASAPLSA